MQLKSISYTQFEGRPKEWRIKDFSFGDINLIVGRNATGKSRTLNVIKGLGNLVSGDVKLAFKSGNYSVIFDKDDENLEYSLKYEESKVIEESLMVGSVRKLKRGFDEVDEIYAEELKENMKFQAPPSELVCVIRRDDVQHPFFEDLYTWGKNFRHYQFGTQMGKGSYVLSRDDERNNTLNLKNYENIVKIFIEGKKEYSDKFVNFIKEDMGKIGYNLDKITVGTPTSIIFDRLIENPQGIIARESDLKGETDQSDMSQGMFRALSLLIQLNYSFLASIPSCILIDDIGEGLDYERSSSLIKLLIDKAEQSHVQIIMSTNDRFVMNNVPLKYWSIMQRSGNESKVYTSSNSKKRFEDFELTGLNNFDFFSSEFFNNKSNKE